MFIGELDYPLLDILVKLDVYGQQTFLDVQALCPVGQEHTMSAGHRPPSLLALIVGFLKSLLGCVEYVTCLLYRCVVHLVFLVQRQKDLVVCSMGMLCVLCINF